LDFTNFGGFHGFREFQVLDPLLTPVRLALFVLWRAHS